MPRAPRAVRLVDDEHVGHLEQSRLVRLHGVTPARRHHDDGGVGRRRDLHLHLADADGLDDDHFEAGGAEQAHGVGRGQGQPAEVPPGRHGPDEDGRVERVLAHPDPVPEDGAAAEGRGRVHRQDRELRHRLAVGPGPAAPRRDDQPVGQGGLARTGCARQAEGVGRRGPIGQLGHGGGGATAALDVGQQPRHGDAVAGAGPLEQRRRIRARGRARGRAHRRVTLAPRERRSPARSS